MIFLAGEVVDQARDLHPTLSKTNAPNALLLRELTRALHDLYTAIYPRVPELLAQTLTILVSDIDFTNQGKVDLAALIPGGWLDLTQGEFMGAPNSLPVRATAEFIPWQQRRRPGRLPAFCLLGTDLFVIGPSAFYANYYSFDLTYTPRSPTAAAMGTEITLPEDARVCLSSRLAHFALMRMVGNPQFQITTDVLAMYAARAGDDWRSFLTSIFRVTQRQRHSVRDVLANPGGPWVP